MDGRECVCLAVPKWDSIVLAAAFVDFIVIVIVIVVVVVVVVVVVDFATVVTRIRVKDSSCGEVILVANT